MTYADMASKLLCLLILTSTVCFSEDTNCGVPIVKPKLEPPTHVDEPPVAVPHSWPWMVQLRYYQAFQGGATVINRRYILTAAHLFDRNSEVIDWTAHFGKHSLEDREAGEQERTFLKYILHPLYQKNYTVDQRNPNDIAVVLLNEPIEYGPTIQPICLPGPFSVGLDVESLYKPNNLCIVTGWGRGTYYGPASDYLKQVVLPIIETEICQSWYGKNVIRQSHMICAGYKEGGQDSCRVYVPALRALIYGYFFLKLGDSGGPLVTRSGGRWYQVGLVSFGNGCGQAQNPGVYTKISAYQEWITAVTEDQRTSKRYCYKP